MNNYFNPAAEPYPIHVFPQVIRDAIIEVREKVKAPNALIAMSFLSAISIACQGLVDVKLPIGQISPVSLNLLLKAESGERKTATDKIVAAPIYRHDEDSVVQYERELVKFESNLSFWKTVERAIKAMIAKAIKNGEDVDHLRVRLEEHLSGAPVKPRSRLFIHQNATEAALMHILEGNGRSIAITSDEADVVFGSGMMNRMGLRNKGWDGVGLLMSERVSTGSIISRQPRVTINLMVQDAVFSNFQRGKGAFARGSGFWARYLVGAPASTRGFRFIAYVDEQWYRLPDFHARVSELLMEYDTMVTGGTIKREVLEFDAEASAKWIEVLNMTEGMIQPLEYLNDVQDFASKIMEISSRVAALLHFFTKQSGKITFKTLEQARDIVRWHLEEYKCLFAPQGMTTTMSEDVAAVERFLHSNFWMHGVERVSKNHVLRNGPNHLRSKSRLEPVIEALVAQGRILLGKDTASNRIVIGLNPLHFGSFGSFGHV
jgi:hypothetical protein